MEPCLTRCIDCVFSEETLKRLSCKKGFFDVKITDGILLVPYDYDCISWEGKNNETECGKM